MTTLLLVRHGESEANRLKFFAGNTDVSLDEKGIEQAKRTGKYIFENYKVDVFLSSDLNRAFTTASLISQYFGAEVTKNKNLREIFAGLWEGKSFDFLQKEYSEDYSRWRNDIGTAVCTGGESVKELSERIQAELLRIAEENPDKTVLIATHATPIRAMMCLLNGKNLSAMKDIPWVSNASVTELFFERGSWHFGKEGADAHLADIKSIFPKNV